MNAGAQAVNPDGQAVGADAMPAIGALLDVLPLPLLHPGHALLRDLAAGQPAAARFFTVPPGEPDAALRAAAKWRPAPRRTSASRARPRPTPLPAPVAEALIAHQRRCDGDGRSVTNAKALAAGRASCIVTGQQAGLLGGPVYTAYKIATAIRLAHQASLITRRRCVPVFWLASEDHDVSEANHAFGTKPDGEIGRVSFRAAGGRELSRLPLDHQIIGSSAEYFGHLLPAGVQRRVRALYTPGTEHSYTGWVARVWMRLFGGTGLVVVEPALLRPACGELFERALAERGAVATALAGVAGELTDAGYAAPLDPAAAGVPFRIEADGRRVRITDAAAELRRGAVDPAALSTDAALRPIFADALLPNLAHVVGPGELSYHAMLKPLYDLFGVAQPAVLPRRSMTFVTFDEAETLDRYAVAVRDAVTGAVHAGAATAALLGRSGAAAFERAAAGIRAAFEPLAGGVAGVDPGLERTWRRSRDHALRGLTRLQSRTGRAILARRGYSPAELHRLLNQLRPRGRPQERVFPVAHFLSRFGQAFFEACLFVEPAGPFTHEVVALPAAPEYPVTGLRESPP